MIIAVDFDGVLNATAYPNVGEAIPGAIEGMQKLHSLGHTLIIWTCRAGKELEDAIEWLLENEVPFVGVNCNTTERIRQYSNDSRKISADLYIDDCIVGGFPGWETVLYHIYKRQQECVQFSK